MNLGLRIGLSASTYAAVVTPPLVPQQVTAGSGYTGATSWPTVTGAGSGFGALPTESATVRGTGYTQKVIAESTHVYYDYNPDYIMFIGGADYERTGAITWEIYFENSTPVTFTQADYRWDPVRKIYGLPIQFLPRAGYSGIYRFYAKCIPTNGLERMITGEVWLNAVATTGYYDRHANAIYVSGVDYNGSDSIGFAGVGTNNTTVGTSTNPNFRLNKAMQYAFGAKEGCYIYVKGAVVDDTNGVSRPTTTAPCRIMPWPGCATNQAKWGKTTRATVGNGGGDILPIINKYEVFSITIDSDTIVKMSGNSVLRSVWRNCNFLSGLSVEVDAWGFPKGIQNTVATSNSQSWAQTATGERNEMIDCTGSIYCATGFQKVICSTINYAWDAVYFQNVSTGMKNFAFIGSKFTGADFAYGRMHQDEELTIAAAGVTLDANGWTVITTTTANPLFNNVFEVYIRVLTGALAGQLYFGGQTITASYQDGDAGSAAISGAIPPGAFPTGNRIYYKGDLTASLAAGDKLRVYSIAHKDTGQLVSRTGGQLDPFFENILYHGSAFVSKDAQWFLNQVGNYNTSAFPGTVSISAGTTATFSNSQTFLTGHVLHMTASNEYAMIAAGGTGTVFTLDRALTTVSGAAFTIGSSVKDILIENCLFDTIDADDYQGQWQVGAINANLVHSTFSGATGATSGQTTLRQNMAGFGVQDWVARNNLFRSMAGDSTGFPATGLTIANNHFVQGTARGSSTTTGSPSFAASGAVTSSYYPTAAVQTCSSVYLPYDRLGNARAVGAKVGCASG